MANPQESAAPYTGPAQKTLKGGAGTSFVVTVSSWIVKFGSLQAGDIPVTNRDGWERAPGARPAGRREAHLGSCQRGAQVGGGTWEFEVGRFRSQANEQQRSHAHRTRCWARPCLTRLDPVCSWKFPEMLRLRLFLWGWKREKQVFQVGKDGKELGCGQQWIWLVSWKPRTVRFAFDSS